MASLKPARKTNRLITIFWADGAGDRLGSAVTIEIDLGSEAIYHIGDARLEVVDVHGKSWMFERGPILYTLASDLTSKEYKEWKARVNEE